MDDATEDAELQPEAVEPAPAEPSAIERLLARLGRISDPDNDYDGKARGTEVASFGGSVFGSMATTIVANGWSIFPQMAIGDRRMPGRVDGQTIKWREHHHLEEMLPAPEALAKWTAQCRGHNIALVCGRASSDVVVMDIDILDYSWNAKILGLAVRILGQTPFRRVGKAPKIALFYRWSPSLGDEKPPGSIARRFLDEDGQPSADGLELLSRGKPVTIFGMHHTTGRDFRWSGPSPFDAQATDLPVVSPEQVKEFFDAVGAIRPFYRGSSFEGGVDMVWTTDPDTDIIVPRMKRSGAEALGWIEDPKSGKVVDGRDQYLNKMVFAVVTNNAAAVGDKRGVDSLKKAILDQFGSTAMMDGRWVGERLRQEIDGRVDRLVGKVRAGDIKASKPLRDRDGSLLQKDVRVAGRVPAGGEDSLSFLPAANADVGDEVVGNVRTRLRVSARSEGQDEAEILRKRKAREIVRDRTMEASRTSTTIDKAVGEFLSDLYAPLGERRSVVHLLKTPTGSGKTSRTFRTIAFDERTKEPYEMAGKDGPETGRFPFLVLMPTYANIEELKSRADVLNLDPSLDDKQFAEAAEEMGLLPEGAAESRIAMLKAEASSAGLRTMIYRGKVAAGCRMVDKMKMAMDANISTSGFCRAEIRNADAEPGQEKEVQYCPYHPDINVVDPCPAILQRKEIEKSHVVFLPHAFMALTLPEELQKVRAVIADERIHGLFLHVAMFPLGTFMKERSPPKLTKKERAAGTVPEELVQDRSVVARIAVAALQARKDVALAVLDFCREEARAAKEKNPEFAGNAKAKARVEHAKRCCAGAWETGKLITPELTVEDLKIICEMPTGVHVKEEHRFWSIVLEKIENEIETGVIRGLKQALRHDSTGRGVDRPADMRIQLLMPHDEKKKEQVQTVRIAWRTEPNWPDRPLLLLDASAAPEIVCKVLQRKREDIRETPLETSMNVQTVAVIDQSYATTKIAPHSEAARARLDAAKLVDRLRRMLTMLSSAYGYSRVVAGTTMAIRRVIGTGWKCPGNMDWVHFGALRGLDFAKYHAAAVSIGRLEPPISAIDGMCAALTYDDPDPEPPFDLFGTGLDAEGKPLRLPDIPTVVKMRSGHDYMIEVPGFPELTPRTMEALGRDSWHRIVHKQFREEEQSQFLGRLRPVYREGETPVWFCVAKVVPEGVIVDDLVSLDDLINAGRCAPALWEAVRRSEGVLHPFLAASRERTAFGFSAPDLYATPEDVRRDMKRVGMSDETGSFRDSRFAWGFHVVGMTLPGGGKSFAYVRSDVADPMAAVVEAMVYAGYAVTDPFKAGQAKEPDKRIASRVADKVESELGGLKERHVIEKEIVLQASLRTWMSLQRDRKSMAASDAWYVGLRKPDAEGRLAVPLAPEVQGKPWDITVFGEPATLAQRVAFESIERVRVRSDPDAETAGAGGIRL